MTILLKSIDDSESILMVSDTNGFPQDDGVIQIDSEIITYSTIYMNTLYGCTRGARSSSAATHDKGAEVLFLDSYAAPSSGSVTFPLLAPDGSLSAPSYSFTGDPNTGVFSGGDGLLQIAVDATSVIEVTATDTTLNGLVFLENGTVSDPSLQIGSNQGLFSSAGTGDLSVSILGVETAKFDHSAVTDDTRFMLWDVTAGTLVRVTRGASDSGGMGFRLLRIPN